MTDRNSPSPIANSQEPIADSQTLPGRGQGTGFWLTIFLPCGITWECADGAIQTRRTATGQVIMPNRRCSGPAESWMSAARNLQEQRPAPATIENPCGTGGVRRVVMLSAEEEAELERLYQQKKIADRKVYELTKAARLAVQQRNLMQKELRRITGLWLPLAERKYPQ